MSANTLNNRSTGQTILDTFFNDIHSSLDGDFVGRGATGIPTSGQNLGTLALPWGTIYGSTINLNGSSLDTTKIVSPANRIVSGKKRSTSNQPAFLTPNGAAASFILSGASTNLNVVIGGAAVSVVTDITKTGLTLAPSSQNTATINDTTAAGQADTRRWGEYWSNKIIIASAGSNITAAIGTFQTFKVVDGAVTEYFTAFVESATLLSHCYRGFFYDPSLNPIKRVVLNNSDTITLMKTGFVYITNDATTVDVGYTTPTWSAVAPSSPASSDYWFDLVNLIWKRYDGASWVIINRILIGMVVMDATNCVAARSFDFYNAYASSNTMDLEITTTATIIRAKRQNQKVNVAGNDIYFGQSLPTFVGASNYVGSTDYYTTFGASTNYFLYIKDDGTIGISDMEPYYRPDLYGFYHPHNPWRCIATAASDGSSNWAWVSTMKENVSAPQSNIYLTTRTAYGSTNTKIGRFTNIRNQQGADLLLQQSSTLGDSITVLTTGIYAINVGTKSDAVGISVNTTAPTTTANASLTYAQGFRAYCQAVSGALDGAGIVLPLQAGDVIREHDDGGGSTTGDWCYFSVTRIA